MYGKETIRKLTPISLGVNDNGIQNKYNKRNDNSETVQNNPLPQTAQYMIETNRILNHKQPKCISKDMKCRNYAR